MIVDKRVIRNHNKLKNKNIDINNIIEGNILDNNTIIDICNRINSMDINSNTKYSLALENTCYSLDENNRYYDIDNVSQTITEYFLYNGICSRTDIESILEKVSLKKKMNKNKIKELLNKFPYEKITKVNIESIIRKFYTLSEDNIINETPNFLIWIRRGLVISTVAANPFLGVVNMFIDLFVEMSVKRSEIKRMITKLEQEKKKAENDKGKGRKDDLDKYIKELDKNIDKLKIYEDSLYSERELNSRNGYDNDDFDISLESTELELLSFTKEEYIEKYHNLFVGEIRKAVNKCHKLIVSNSAITSIDKYDMFKMVSEDEITEFENIEVDDINEYVYTDNRLVFPILSVYHCEQLQDDDIKKINDIFSHLITEIESVLDERIFVKREGSITKYSLVVGLDIPLSGVMQENTMNKDLKEDLAFILALNEEMTILQNNMETITESMTNFKDISILEESNIETMSEVQNKLRDIIDKDLFKESLLYIKDRSYRVSDIVKATSMASTINESIYQLSNKDRKTILKPKSRYELLSETIKLNQDITVINELSLGNKIRVLQQNIARKSKGLSDKEKMISKELDSKLENLYNKVERDLTNKNREKVIKGSILPSASSIIKIALITPIAFTISPALTVIGMLGAIATSKRATEKERQFVLDEINIMLKMTEKKIRLAENNNDMKALEQLLRTQQQLERERQRIRYNLRRRNNTIIYDNNSKRR